MSCKRRVDKGPATTWGLGKMGEGGIHFNVEKVWQYRARGAKIGRTDTYKFAFALCLVIMLYNRLGRGSILLRMDTLLGRDLPDLFQKSRTSQRVIVVFRELPASVAAS
jgi:hypothetical protein